MMFKSAVLNATTTTNGMPAVKSTGSALLDFFAASGAMRNWPEHSVWQAFIKAQNENTTLANRALFHARNIRGGQGERKLFRTILHRIAESEQAVEFAANLPLVPKYGRWDDLMVVENTVLEPYAAALWVDAIRRGDGLAAKWAPRKGHWFGILRKMAGLDGKQWRQLLVEKTRVVETQMCAQQWSEINYPHVPSRAAMIYRKAFSKRDTERYVQFIQDAKKGKVKINSAALFPVDIVSRIKNGPDDTLEAQWLQLPNYLGQDDSGILPVVDVSGSMAGTPMDVSVSLGIYLAERNQGKFKDLVVTFSERPKFVDISTEHSLYEKVRKVMQSRWQLNTNLELTLMVMLDHAVRNNVPQEEMPSRVLIISDMQFDQATTKNDNAMMLIERTFLMRGYRVPEIVFWNVNAVGNQPSKNAAGVSLVSGYSPSIVKALLAKTPQQTSEELMLDVLKQYEDVL